MQDNTRQEGKTTQDNTRHDETRQARVQHNAKQHNTNTRARRQAEGSKGRKVLKETKSIF